MRLTLRTLLAYLDDALEPRQARQIGQKVAESEKAQELVDRIKKVTRRRRLGNPPTDDAAKIDPNTVAEYLSDQLSAEQTTAVEETCLADDVYLAEVAACHQILTLMLSEPAIVPPPARQRMYRLVKGRESIPYRKPPPAPSFDVTNSGAFDPGDSTVLGVFNDPTPTKWRQFWLPLLAASLLCVAVGLAVYHSIPAAPAWEPEQQVVVVDTPADTPAPTPPPRFEPPPPQMPLAVAAAETPVVVTKPPEATKPAVKPPEETKPAVVTKPPVPTGPFPDVKPSTRELGKLEPADSTLLLASVAGGPWQRVREGTRVGAEDRLVAPPTFTPEVTLDSGVRVRLAGNLPGTYGSEPSYPLYEAEVRLHEPAAGYDADLTLDAGRVRLTSRKADGPTRVLLRVAGQTWLAEWTGEATEVVADLIARYAGERFAPQGDNEPPTQFLTLGVARGKAELRPTAEAAPVALSEAGPAALAWDSLEKKPVALPKPPGFWAKLPGKRTDADYDGARKTLNQRLSKPLARLDVALAELRDDLSEPTRRLAIATYGAVQALPELIDALQDTERKDVRDAAAAALIDFVANRPGNNRRLYEVLTGAKGYPAPAAGILVQLAQGLNVAGNDTAYFFLLSGLMHERLGVRELSWRRLDEVDKGGAVSVRYSPTANDSERFRAAQTWTRRLQQKLQQAPPPTRPPGGGGR